MAMLAPVHVENFGRLFGSNQPISAHFTAFNSSDQLQQKRFDLYKEALGSWYYIVCCYANTFASGNDAKMQSERGRQQDKGF